jgi:hypothetical protein
MRKAPAKERTLEQRPGKHGKSNNQLPRDMEGRLESRGRGRRARARARDGLNISDICGAREIMLHHMPQHAMHTSNRELINPLLQTLKSLERSSAVNYCRQAGPHLGPHFGDVGRRARI